MLHLVVCYHVVLPIHIIELMSIALLVPHMPDQLNLMYALHITTNDKMVLNMVNQAVNYRRKKIMFIYDNDI